MGTKHYHCPICGAEFDSRDEVEEHDRLRHTQQGVSGVAPSNVYRESARGDSERKNREFGRRNPE